MSDLPHGVVTFLFTDIEGSTRLWERYPLIMPGVIARHDALMRQTVSEHRGVVFKMVGDAVCAAFASATDALASTITAQKRLEAEDWGEVGTIRVRMALHAGAAELRDGDYFGQPLNRVARLLSAGHGGQVLISRGVADIVRSSLPEGVLLQDMGEHRLKDLQLPEQISQVVADGLPSSFPALKTLDYRPNNLPQQPTALIGRDRELHEAPILAGDSDVRLATLTGPGGMGKTRLALHAAAELIDSFHDGVFFVPLAAISDPELVAPTIAQSLGLRETPGQTITETLVDYLASKEMLLLLDNFEQILPAAPLVAQLLAAAPYLKILVTSRSRLNLRGEHEYALPPLELPDRGAPIVLEQIMQCSAVQLFVERATLAHPRFELTEANARVVVEICRRLDGLPLAIELAAARVRLLAPKSMLERLSRSIDVLSGGQRDLPDRHQALRGTIAWSYDLLTPSEQALFRRLSVFTGGWSFEATEAIAADGDGDVLDDLMALVDHNLVQRIEDADDDPRFAMLQMIDAYAAEQLDAHGETDGFRERHATYFLTLALDAEPYLDRTGQDGWLDQLEQEHDNLRAALRWYEERSPVDGLRLATALWQFWVARGFLSEGRGHLGALLHAPEAQGATLERASALSAASMLAQGQDDFRQATQLSEEVLAVLESLGERRGRAMPLHCLGTIAIKQGDYERAAPLLEQSLALARETRDEFSIIIAIRNLGLVAISRGDVEQARSLLEESLSLARRRGDRSAIASALGNLGFIALRTGQLEAAQASFAETLTLARQMRDKLWISMALLNLGVVAAEQGAYQQALGLYQECLVLCRELGSQLNAVSCLEEIGTIANALGLPEPATQLFGAAASWRLAHDAPLMDVEREMHEPHVESARSALGVVSFSTAWSLGQTMTLDAAIDLALAIDHAPASAAPVPAAI